MHAHPPVANSLFPLATSAWLPPMQFRVRSYLQFCRSFDEALAELEARYPAKRPLLTIEDRQKRILKRRPR
jgi:hypothetical protein